MKAYPVLLIDIGNTSITIGLGSPNKVARSSHFPTTACTVKKIRSIISSYSQKKAITGAIICSVVPALTPRWEREVKTITGKAPVIVTHEINLGIEIDYPKPYRIGPDRLANASGAAARYGIPVIAADFGTALTFDVISKDNKYVGGVIAPGLPLMTDYLAEKTALLPHIHLKGKCESIGKSTESAMRTGAKVGYRGIVREIISHIKKGLSSKKVHLCATGGFAKWALEDIDLPIAFDPDLTLHGLFRIYELNKETEN